MLDDARAPDPLLREHGADDVDVLEFTRELSLQTPQEFIEQVLIGELAAVADRRRAQLPVRSSRERETSRCCASYDLAVDDVAAADRRRHGLLDDGPGASSYTAMSRPPRQRSAGCTSSRARSFAAMPVAARWASRPPTSRVDDEHRGPAGRRLRRLAHPGRAASGSRPRSASGPTRRSMGVERRVEAYAIDVGHELDLYDEHVVVEFVGSAARHGALRQRRGPRRADAPGRRPNRAPGSGSCRFALHLPGQMSLPLWCNPAG